MFPLPQNPATNLPPAFSALTTPAITSSASGNQCSTALENTASKPVSGILPALAVVPAPILPPAAFPLSAASATTALSALSALYNLDCSSLASITSNRSAGNFFLACPIISSERSSPSTSAPLAAISAAKAPVPQIG